MRFAPALLVLLAIPASADPGDTQWPKGRRMVVKDDGPVHSPDALATFTTAGTLWLMRIGSDAAPRCEAWAVEPKHDREGNLVRGEAKLGYYSSGPRLDVCAFRATAKELDGGGVDVSGMRWFTDEKSCTAAIAHKDNVATDLRACLPDAVTDADRDAARSRFVAIAKTGGSVYDVRDGACHATRFVADKYGPLPAGAMVDDANKQQLPYLFVVTDDVLEITDAGDIEETTVAWGVDRVEWGGVEHWLSADTCKQALQLDAKRAAWTP